MSATTAFQGLTSRLEHVPNSVQYVVGALILGLIYSWFTGDRPIAGLPIVTIEKKGWERLLSNKFMWILHADKVMEKGAELKKPYQVLAGSGYKAVVPNRFADELKSHPDLNFNEAFKRELFTEYPGMDGVRQGLADDSFIQEVVRVKLTQSLGLVTDDLVEESNDCMNELLGDNAEWHVVAIKDKFLDIVARLSARVFLGKELCRDKEWLQVSKDYTVDSFVAANLLRMCPDLLRPVLFWAIPQCRRCVTEVKFARKFIQPEVDRRIKRAQEAMAAGVKVPKQGDAIAWMVEVARGRKIDYVAAQLALTTAAIHTTSETSSKCILALCDHPEVIQPLREEMIKVLSEDGWSKVSLYKLQLLDSFLKEVQRDDGLATTNLNRFVTKDVTLSDGTKLPAGIRLMVTDDQGRNPAVYTNPDKFDVARFLKLRNMPGEENRHQFVTTTGNHMAFGHGQHACPGRFFASNEIKIALCFLLLKYDLRYVPGDSRPQNLKFETSQSVSPSIRVQMRRRKEEIDLMNPKVVR